MHKKWSLLAVFLFFSLAWSAEKSYYSNLNTFLYGVPQYWATGGSDITFADDGMAVSNPAVLPLNEGSRLLVGYTGFYKNAFSTSSASFVTGVNDKIRFSLGVSYLLIPDIEITDGLVADEFGHPAEDVSVSKFKYESSSETFLNVSLGYNILEKKAFILTAGASIHGMRRRLIDWTGYGVGVDLAAAIELKKVDLRFALLANDIVGNYINWSSSYTEYSGARLRLGIGYEKEIPYIYGKVKVTYKSPDIFGNEGVSYIAINHEEQDPKSGSVKSNPELLLTTASYGFDYLIKDVFAIRVGFDELKRLSFGAGLDLFSRSLGFDFAYTLPYGLAGTYAMSISYNW